MITLSRVGLGTNNFGRRLDLERSRAVLEAALAVGVTHVDTADVYGDGASERFIGEILSGRRGEAFVATKFGGGPNGGGSPAYVGQALDASLERLRTDHVDLLYYHWPDRTTPIAETVGAMQALLESGKVRYLGLSNVDASQLREGVATAPIAVVQNRYSLLERGAEAEMLPLCAELGVGFVPYFPLASGLLTGKYRRGEPSPRGTRLEAQEIDDETFDRLEALERFARERGRTLLELAIAVLAARPAVVTVIAGAMSAEQVRANAEAAAWQPSPDDLAALPA